MRWFTKTTLAAGALLASLSSAVASPNPNYEISKTSVNVNKHREKLDNGEIIVRVQRTDDLFSDPTADHDAKLLLEKNTHIALRIQLDKSSGKVNVNDQPLDVTDHKGATLTGLKVDTYRLPHGHDSPVVSADELYALMDQLSAGIAKIEVRLETEPVSPAIGMATYTEGEELPSIESISVRKVGLWIRITEIEGKEVVHSYSIYTPILQLVVTSSGGKVNKISTLAIDGKAPLDALAQPGPAVGQALPEAARQPHHGPPHHHDRPAEGLLGWISGLFGGRRPERPGRAGLGRRPGCHRGQQMQKEAVEKAASAKAAADSSASAASMQHDDVADHIKGPGLAGMGGAPLHRGRPHAGHGPHGEQPSRGKQEPGFFARLADTLRPMLPDNPFYYALGGWFLCVAVALCNLRARSYVVENGVRREVPVFGSREAPPDDEEKEAFLTEKEKEVLQDAHLQTGEALPKYRETTYSLF